MKNILFILLAFLSVSFRLYAQDVIKIGIIGLDTSHSTAFTELLNGDSDDKFVKEFEVVAAYPYGSKTIQSSYERIPGYIEEVKKHGVEITSSIAELLDKVDCVMLETNDGRIHLEQAMEVFKSGKICYIDKPIGATLGQAIAIYEMAEKYNVPIFSSSALRYSPQNQKLRNGEFGKILGADCYSPHKVASRLWKIGFDAVQELRKFPDSPVAHIVHTSSFMLLPAPSCKPCRSWGYPLRCAGTGSRCSFWSCGEGLRG